MKKALLKILTANFLVLLLAGCGSDNPSPPVVVTPPPPPPPMPTSFNQFVVDQFATTADDTDPVLVDDEDFAFDEDPAAFDSVLQ